MIRTLVTPAAEQPLTLAEARSWLAFEAGVTEDDAIISELIQSITAYVERRFNGRKIVTQTWAVTLDADEVTNPIRIKLAPLQSVSSITTYDDAGDATVVDSSNYQVTTGENPRVILTPSGSWPAMRDFDSMVITCAVGYGDADEVPDDIKLVIRHILSHQYASKGMGVYQTVSGQIISTPQIAERAIKSLRLEPWA